MQQVTQYLILLVLPVPVGLLFTDRWNNSNWFAHWT